MKSHIIYLLLLLPLFTKIASAQSITIKLNSIRDVDSIATIQYHYPEFRDGRVFFVDKGITPGKLNYSRVNGEILFKDQDKILALNKLEAIEKVTIANDTFLVSPAGGFVKLITAYPSFSLTNTLRIKLSDRERKVAYGNYSNVSSSQAVITMPGEDQFNIRTGVDENLTFVLTKTYYILTPLKKLIEATEKGVLLAFPNHKKQLKAYISATRVDFNNLQDLDKMLQYVQSLN